MPFDIPEPYKWDESFKVFYELLDTEHQGLFDGIFDVAKNPGDAGKLSYLVSILDKHFTDEEGMMAAKNYSDLAPHKEAHKAFLDKMKKVAAPVDSKTVHYAKDWLVQHIKGTDFKYKGQLD